MGAIAAAFAVLALAAVPWATLCLGEDGHVAFEVVVDGRCLDGGKSEPSAEHPVHLTACEQETGCGPCTDLRSTADAWLASASSDLPDAGLALVSVVHAAIPQPAPAAASSRLESAAAAYLSMTMSELCWHG
jgi:hypothetical protein